jgi:hypothetical protein
VLTFVVVAHHTPATGSENEETKATSRALAKIAFVGPVPWRLLPAPPLLWYQAAP